MSTDAKRTSKGALLLLGLAAAAGIAASACNATNESANSLDIAVIGDAPYESATIALFPVLVQAINADPRVREVVHMGDLKSGIEPCSDTRFQVSVDLFNRFKDPFVYVMGDNEWVDCHRDNNGSYNPLERLAKVRQLLYPGTGRLLREHPRTVEAQPGYPENQLWVESRVTFATLHMLGSNNGLHPWFGDRKVNNVPVPETPEEGASRVAEVTARQAANHAWLEGTFATAKAHGSVGIVLFFQADLWHPEDRAIGAVFSAHQAWIERFSELAREFPGKILLVGGDSHEYRVDDGVPWMAAHYGVPSPSNVTQVIVDRSVESPASDAAPNRSSTIEWLRLHIDPRSPDIFSWEQVIVQ
ncbi:MAG: hypothetical protein H0W15_00620 [Gemmatimonadales bacterium]|nr:hypothetical protein [Gemmatimonadales bacterium]